MTKISAQTPTINTQTGSAQSDTGKTDGELFSRAMETAISRQQSSSATGEAGSLGEIQSPTLPPISSIDSASTSTTDSLVLQTDELLTVIDTYAEQMADPSVSLKEMEGMVADLQTMAGELSQSVSGSDCDSDLKEIADQCAVIAQTEAIKFMRGDYV